MATPAFVADFDSATGLVRALAAALRHQPYRRLGRSRSAGAAVAASRLLPERLRTRAFAVAGGREAIAPASLPSVDPEGFTQWVIQQYGPRSAPAVAVGSSNGAVMHLCAALGIPWLPQTFLVPVRRDRHPDDCTGDVALAASEALELLGREPGLQIHQMHDPNQDRLMVSRLGYFRMKLRSLTAAYRDYLRATLDPGGTIVIVDCGLTWPVTTIGERHVFQHGAVGGLAPEDYDHGSARVAEFLAREGADARSWQFPPTDGEAPEAEWGYEPALTADVEEFAARHGYRVVELRFPGPESPSRLVADAYLDAYGGHARRLLAETFICVEPTWVLQSRSVPLWLTFATESSLATLDAHLRHGTGGLTDLLVTLFPHGVRSAGIAPAEAWIRTGTTNGLGTTLAGVARSRWPADFASLATYSRALRRVDRGDDPPPPMTLEWVEAFVSSAGAAYDVSWRAR